MEQERAEKEQERARNDRVRKRNSKGLELIENGKMQEGFSLIRHNSITATSEESQKIESLVRSYFPNEIFSLLHIESNRANAQSL